MKESENEISEEQELIDFNDPNLIITEEQEQAEEQKTLSETSAGAKKRYQNATGLPANPLKYNTHVKPRLEAILAWKRDGLSNKQVAQNLGIDGHTLISYSKIYKELADAITTGRADHVANVENAQTKLALGHFVTIHHEKCSKDGTIIKWDDQSYYPPNPQAQQFILTNLAPDKWKTKIEQTTTHELSFATMFKEIGEIQLQNKSKERELDPSKMVTLPTIPAKALPEPPN